MNRLAVDGTGYTEASTLLHNANLWGAYCFDRLRTALAHGGSMAGDSSFADAFSREYDAAAADAMDAFAAIITASGNLGHLAFVSWENHSRAELASTYGAIRPVGDVGLGAPDWVDVMATCLPSALGGDPSSLPGWANMILDHVEGFVWPDADLDLLRATAEAWRLAGDGLDDVATYPGRAIGAMLSELSPEILPATAALGRLKAAAGDLAAYCRDIGGQCDAYATAVEEQRQAILDLVRDLLLETVAIQAAGFVIGLATAGLANGVAASANLAKIAAAAPRFKRCLDAVRRFADEAAEALSGTQLAMAGVSTRVRPMTNTRLLMTAETSSVAKGGGEVTERVLSFLQRHEGGPMGAHTLERHVGKTDDYLRERLAQGRQAFISTYTDEAAAEKGVMSLINGAKSRIDHWLFQDSPQRLILEDPAIGPLGRGIGRDGVIVPTSGARAVLIPDATMSEGYHVLSSYPLR